MAGRRTNLALFVLLAVTLATGGVAYAIGTSWAWWAVAAHGVAGLAMLLLAPWTTAIARRGMGRRRPDNWASVLFGALLAVCMVFGLAHSTGLLVDINGYAVLNLHVTFAVLSFPFAVWHVVARRVAPRRTDWSRRNFLRATGLLGGAAMGYAAVEGALGLAGTAAGGRRFTGSYETGSFDPLRMPVTQWLDDAVPEIDARTWRLAITEADGATREVGYEELAANREPVRATIDCTGGWFAHQDWEGVRLDRLLGDTGEARSVGIRSVTGYGRRFPVR